MVGRHGVPDLMPFNEAHEHPLLARLRRQSLSPATCETAWTGGRSQLAARRRTRAVLDAAYAKKLLRGSRQICSMVGAAVMATPPTLTVSTSAFSGFTRTLRAKSGQSAYWPGFRVSGARLYEYGPSAGSGIPRGAPHAGGHLRQLGRRGARRVRPDRRRLRPRHVQHTQRGRDQGLG